MLAISMDGWGDWLVRWMLTIIGWMGARVMDGVMEDELALPSWECREHYMTCQLN